MEVEESEEQISFDKVPFGEQRGRRAKVSSRRQNRSRANSYVSGYTFSLNEATAEGNSMLEANSEASQQNAIELFEALLNEEEVYTVTMNKFVKHEKRRTRARPENDGGRQER